MAHYPYVNLSGSAGGCTTELTQIAAASTLFTSDSDYLSTDEYYIGTNNGWSSCELNITNKPGNNFLPINHSNCVINLPINVKPGDTLKICGIASGTTSFPFSDGSFFGIALNTLTCGNPDNTGWTQTNILKEDFSFLGNQVCWSATYTYTEKLPACNTMFTLGFATEETGKPCNITWTFDLETVCLGPCESEHTNVASHSIKFNATDSYTSSRYYGFNEKCGWRGDGSEQRVLSSGVLAKNWGHNGIKLPVNLVADDVIRVCGLASGVDNNSFTDSAKFGSSLNFILCSEAETAGDGAWPLYNLTMNEAVFKGNATCFSFEYTIPVGSPLIACDTMLVLGFGTDELNKDCLVSYSLNVIKPCGSCTSEYTPIAQSSGNFNQGKIAGEPLWYIGDKTCGWSGCSLSVLQEIQRQEIGSPLAIENSNCGIKLPYDLVQGDKIVICGTTTCVTADVNGTGFFPALTKFMCNGYDPLANAYSVAIGLAFGSSTFSYGSTTCWTLEYVVPLEGMLACDTNLLLGLKSQIDAESYIYSWTMNIVKLCPGPQEVGCCFTHAKTLFVDPNGNDLTALEGKQTKPWKTIGAAVDYLADNTRTGYTIEVFPGDYLNEQAWFFDFKNTDTTIKLNGNVNIGGATTITPGKGLIQVENANLKIVGDDRTNSTFAYGGPGAYIQGNSINDSIIYSLGTTNISVSNVSLNNVGTSPVIVYEADTDGGKLTLNEVSLLSVGYNILVTSCPRPPVINIKDSVLYVGSDNSTTGVENIKIESVQGSYNPATWIFIENSRLVINGGFDSADSHIWTDCGNSISIRGIFNGVLFYWKTISTVYIWRDNTGNNINVEIINPVVTDHDSWAGASTFSMVTGFGLHTFKGLANPSLYDG